MLVFLDEVVGKGEFATVFVASATHEAGMVPVVVKVYRSLGTAKKNDVIREMCLAECQAYELAMASDELRQHVPQFFGRIELDAVRDRSTNADQTGFVLDAAIVLERLPGTPKKYQDLTREESQIAEALFDRFYEAGIRSVADGSILFGPEEGQTRLIDFAVREVAASYWSTLREPDV